MSTILMKSRLAKWNIVMMMMMMMIIIWGDVPSLNPLVGKQRVGEGGVWAQLGYTRHRRHHRHHWREHHHHLLYDDDGQLLIKRLGWSAESGSGYFATIWASGCWRVTQPSSSPTSQTSSSSPSSSSLSIVIVILIWTILCWS